MSTTITKPRQILVTSALLYANGPLHLGHLLEQIQADIWVRFQRLNGHVCSFIGGDDTHGTPIMLAADKRGISPEALITEIFAAHQHDLNRFQISFDHFGSTHCAENQFFVNTIYQLLQAKGDINIQIVHQAYDCEKQMFLPDRYIKGICPQCEAADQYGDHCEQCGATYNALELKEPVSVLSNTKPVSKASEQYFLSLAPYTDFLREWITQDILSPQASRKLLEWFDNHKKLEDLAISREAPYFGFLIPGTQDKYFYVWLDAPIGYIAIFKQLCQQKPALDFDNYWSTHTSTELYHVIGKDIVKFHALFWPAMLEGAKFRLPTHLFVHGFLTLEGRKMSKSRGTFITAHQYLEHLNPEYLRYYFASKINGTIEDIDINWLDFTQKINSELVGKFINIASRCAKLLERHCQNQLSADEQTEQVLDGLALIQSFREAGPNIAQFYEKQQFHFVVQHIMGLTNKANQYIDQKKPWLLTTSETTIAEMQQVCTIGLNLFKILTIYLKPILPSVAAQVENFLNITHLQWQDREHLLQSEPNTEPKSTPKTIKSYQPLLHRITQADINFLT